MGDVEDVTKSTNQLKIPHHDAAHHATVSSRTGLVEAAHEFQRETHPDWPSVVPLPRLEPTQVYTLTMAVDLFHKKLEREWYAGHSDRTSYSNILLKEAAESTLQASHQKDNVDT